MGPSVGWAEPYDELLERLRNQRNKIYVGWVPYSAACTICAAFPIGIGISSMMSS